MEKRIFVVHGWGGSPDAEWFPWIKKELKNSGFKVTVPKMPNTKEPDINEWVPYLSKLVGTPDEQTFFIGHSIGCQTILRYLQTINIKVGGIIFVAGWIGLKLEAYEGEEDEEIAKPWIETPLDWEKIKSNCDRFTALFSDNDPFVSVSDSEVFKEKLGAKIIIEKNKSHYEKLTELPIIVDELMKL